MAQLLGLETPGEWQTGYIMTLAWGPQVAGVHMPAAKYA